MAISVKKSATLDNEDYEKISSALELARRYIAKNIQPDRSVDEFSQKEIALIEAAMTSFWDQ